MIVVNLQEVLLVECLLPAFQQVWGQDLDRGRPQVNRFEHGAGTELGRGGPK